jgi:hypothetical protein
MRKKNNTNRNDHVTNGGIVCAIFSKKASLATKKVFAEKRLCPGHFVRCCDMDSQNERNHENHPIGLSR